MGGYSSFTGQFNAVFYNQGEPRTTQDPNTEIYLVKFGKLQAWKMFENTEKNFLI